MTLSACVWDAQAEKFINEREKEIQENQEENAELTEELDIAAPETNIERPNIIDMKKFPIMFWYLCIGTALAQSSILSFNVIGVSYITDKWYANEPNIYKATKDSGEIFSAFRISSFIFSPIIGYIVDRVGHRPMFFILGCLITMLAHIVVIFIHPVIPCILFGLALTLLYTACWPCVMLLVSKENVGKACGLLTSLENVGLVVLPIIDGVLKNAFGSYDDSQIFLAGLSLIATLAGIKLYKQDLKGDRTLQTAKQKSIDD